MGVIMDALLATIFTWALTAAGAAMVFVLPPEGGEKQKKLLDGLLAFAGGVMTAASFWSLLQPAIDLAKASPLYGPDGRWAIVPVVIGFSLGGGAMFAADFILGYFGLDGDPVDSLIRKDKKSDDPNGKGDYDSAGPPSSPDAKRDTLSRRKPTKESGLSTPDTLSRTSSDLERGGPGGSRGKSAKKGGHGATAGGGGAAAGENDRDAWRRVMLLVIAITVHNFPEGLAVGVGFGSIGAEGGTSLGGARSLALGIGLQNFPEGLAVSMPLRREGMSYWQSFFWGQVSGMVEPIGGLLGAYAVSYAQPILPYALSFAAGAMIYVVVDQLVPEAHSSGSGSHVATSGFMAGFVVMMTMDVTLS
mmetsp:Transcript_62302/g.171304  ORF Transcript_62302/g.171304 Transcript_62302/m.171304 type:complete len:361 (-) Transcript_62302:504-1586(-)